MTYTRMTPECNHQRTNKYIIPFHDKDESLEEGRTKSKYSNFFFDVTAIGEIIPCRLRHMFKLEELNLHVVMISHIIARSRERKR